MHITGYKILLKLFINISPYFTNNADNLNEQLYDEFNWVFDILDENEDAHQVLISKLEKEIEYISGHNRSFLEHYSIPLPSPKKFGEYVKKNNLHEDFIDGIGYTIGYALYNQDDKNVKIDTSFDIESATIHMTITNIDKCPDTPIQTKEELIDNILSDSLEDGVYEACYDEGKGFDYYHPLKIDVSRVTDLLKDLDLFKNDERLNTTIITFNTYIGTIDYRKESNVEVEPIFID